MKEFLVILFSILLTLAGCSKENKKSSETTSEIKKFERTMMEHYYYWADQMGSPNPNSYDVQEYFNAMLVKKDRWSWMCDGDQYNSNQTGVSTSFGLHLKQPITYYQDYNVYIAYVDSDSPVGKEGIKRGYQLTKINGTPILTIVSENKLTDLLSNSTNTFTFKDLSGVEKDYQLTQASYKSKSVISTHIFNNSNCPILPPSKKVGYINYLTFNDNMKNEIIQALSQMKEEGIEDLILDLRYNGGGDLDLCTNIASLIAPESANSKTFIKVTHNSTQSSNDFVCSIERSSNSLDLNNLYVITSPSTASASESLINGLSPYMNIITVGEKTYGKPNGMYVILYPNNTTDISKVQYAFYPICFYCLNSQGKADFENGLTPTYSRGDDLYHDFGVEEDLIYSCLNHIATGSVPTLAKKEYATTKDNEGETKRITIPKIEDKQGYGLTTKSLNK